MPSFVPMTEEEIQAGLKQATASQFVPMTPEEIQAGLAEGSSAPPTQVPIPSVQGLAGRGIAQGSLDMARTFAGPVMEAGGQAFTDVAKSIAGAAVSRTASDFEKTSGVRPGPSTMNGMFVPSSDQVGLGEQLTAPVQQNIAATPNILADQTATVNRAMKPIMESPSLKLPPELLQAEYGQLAQAGDWTNFFKKAIAETAQVTPQLGAAAIATALAGPAGAGAVGALQEGGGFYEQAINSGMDPQEALARSGAFGALVGTLNAIPFTGIGGKAVARTPFLSKMVGTRTGGVVAAGADAILEAATETAEGGAQALSLEDVNTLQAIPTDPMAIKKVVDDMAAGAYGESGVALPAALSSLLLSAVTKGRASGSRGVLDKTVAEADRIRMEHQDRIRAAMEEQIRAEAQRRAQAPADAVLEAQANRVPQAPPNVPSATQSEQGQLLGLPSPGMLGREVPVEGEGFTARPVTEADRYPNTPDREGRMAHLVRGELDAQILAAQYGLDANSLEEALAASNAREKGRIALQQASPLMQEAGHPAPGRFLPHYGMASPEMFAARDEARDADIALQNKLAEVLGVPALPAPGETTGGKQVKDRTYTGGSNAGTVFPNRRAAKLDAERVQRQKDLGTAVTNARALQGSYPWGEGGGPIDVKGKVSPPLPQTVLDAEGDPSLIPGEVPPQAEIAAPEPVQTTWPANEGTRSVVGVRPDGRFEVAQENFANTVLLKPEELQAEIARDTRNYERRQAIQAKQREDAATQEATKAQRQNTYGFAESLPGIQGKRAVSILDKQMLVNGEQTTRKAAIENRVNAGATVVKKGNERRLQYPDDANGPGSFLDEKQLSKTAMDYAEYLVGQRGQDVPEIDFGNISNSPATSSLQPTPAPPSAAVAPEVAPTGKQSLQVPDPTPIGPKDYAEVPGSDALYDFRKEYKRTRISPNRGNTLEDLGVQSKSFFFSKAGGVPADKALRDAQDRGLLPDDATVADLPSLFEGPLDRKVAVPEGPITTAAEGTQQWFADIKARKDFLWEHIDRSEQGGRKTTKKADALRKELDTLDQLEADAIDKYGTTTVLGDTGSQIREETSKAPKYEQLGAGIGIPAPTSKQTIIEDSPADLHVDPNRDAERAAKVQKLTGKPIGETFKEKTKKLIDEVKRKSTRAQEFIPADKKNSSVNEMFRLLKAQPSRVGTEISSTISAILEPLGPNQQKFFQHYLFMKNMQETVTNGTGSPRNGYQTPEEVNAEVDRLEALLQSESSMKPVVKAIGQRQAMKAAMTQELKNLGLLHPDTDREWYWHQQVASMHEMTRISSTNRPNPKKRSFQKVRSKRDLRDSQYDLNEDYLQSEFEWMYEAGIEINKEKWLRELNRRVGQDFEKLKAAAKTARDAGQKGVRWTDLIPEGYRLWQPSGRSPFKPSVSPVGRFVDGVISQIEQAEGVDAESMDVKLIDLTQGSRVFVLPDNIVEQLNKMQTREYSSFRELEQDALRIWKTRTLFAPDRLAHYFLANGFGDYDAMVAAAPGISRKLFDRSVWKEAIDYQRGDTNMSQDWMKAVSYGVVDTGQHSVDLVSLEEVPFLKKFAEEGSAGKGAIGKAFQSYFNFSIGANAVRENAFRYAAFKYYQEHLTNKTLKSYGGSNPAVVDALVKEMGIDAAAAHMARNLAGDYSNLTEYGEFLRENLFPFWAFTEINTARTARTIGNTFEEGARVGDYLLVGKDGKPFNEAGLGEKASRALARTLFTGLAVGRIAKIFALTYAFNNLFFPDEEDELSEETRNEMHLNFGRRQDGSVRYYGNVGAIAAAIEPTGLPQMVDLAGQYVNDQLTLGSLMAGLAAAPPKAVANLAVQQLRPDFKAIPEAAMGVSTYPDVFNPRAQSPTDTLLKVVGGDRMAAWARGKPMPNFLERNALGLLTKQPAQEALIDAYMYRDRFLKQIGKNREGVFASDENLRTMRQAVLANDKEAFARYKANYLADGKKFENFKASVTRLDPLTSIPIKNRRQFWDYLNAEETTRFNEARRHAREIERTMRIWWREAK